MLGVDSVSSDSTPIFYQCPSASRRRISIIPHNCSLRAMSEWRKKMEHNYICADDEGIVATGLLIWKGHRHWVKVKVAQLVLDLPSWALSVATLTEDRADASNSEFMAQILRREAEALRKWVREPDGPSTHEFPRLLPRQILKPMQVTSETLDSYLAQVLSVAAPGDDVQPQFYINADLPIVEIWADRDSREIAWFCGDEFLGYTCTKLWLDWKIREYYADKRQREGGSTQSE